MTDIDEKIRQALSEEDQKALDRMGDRYDPFDLSLLAFKGGQRSSAVIVWTLGFVSFALLIYCGYRYFAVDDLKESLTWGIGVVLCSLSIVVAKVIAWQMMQTQVLIREVKRLELRLLSHGGMSDHHSS